MKIAFILPSSFKGRCLKVLTYELLVYISSPSFSGCSEFWAIEPHFFFLFDLILYVPFNNFSVMSGQVFLG